MTLVAAATDLYLLDTPTHGTLADTLSYLGIEPVTPDLLDRHRLPTALGDMIQGYLTPARYVESLRRTRIESVFSAEGPMPSLAELALLPYQIVKKYL